MLDDALNVLKIIDNNGFKAYIVGGFVRDYLLNNKSSDIDICTNATPRELIKIFPNAKLPRENIGAVTIYYKNIRFEITTFRREVKYINNRKPIEIEYINNLEEDILRRDFTINTLCMDKDKNIIDIINGKDDLNNNIIRCVGNSDYKFSEDALRILRAIRFATKLNFRIDEETQKSILKYKYLLKNISYNKKKEELDKIFTSLNVSYGIKLLKKFGLDKELDIKGLDKLVCTDSLVGIWAQLDAPNYSFNKVAMEQINNIRECIKLDNLDSFVLYKYGLYPNSVAASIKGLSREEVTLRYNNLPIKDIRELKIDIPRILSILNKEAGPFIKDIKDEVSYLVLNNKLINDYSVIEKYVVEKYKTL